MGGLIWLSILLLSSSSQADESVDNYIRAILDNFRSQMTTGIPDLGIPVLDPFAVPHFTIPHISEGIAEIDTKIDDLVITGLSTFTTDEVKSDLNALSLSLALGVPLLRGDAVYDLDGTIASILPIYGNGAMWLELTQVVLSASAAIGMDETSQYLQVTELKLDADMATIKMHLDDLLGPGSLGDILNEILNLMAGTIWDLIKDLIFNELDGTLMTIINDELMKCSLNDIVNGNPCFKAVVNTRPLMKY
jgi:hypothetical protein